MNLGELWIDRSDASEHIAALDVSAETAAHLRFFWENGYTIFRNVVPGELVDKIVDGMLSISKDPRTTARNITTAKCKTRYFQLV